MLDFIIKNGGSLMQVLKDEIRENILSKAQDLFIKKGYQKTSMKEIADQCGISKSNLYNYFNGKESIYEILTVSIRENLKDFTSVLYNHHFDHDFGSEAFIEFVATKIHTYVLKDRIGFLLIMNCSEGTNYEKYKENVVTSMAEHFMDDLKEHKFSSALTINVIAENLIEGLLQITNNCTDSRESYEAFYSLVYYHVYGMMALINCKLS